MLFVIVGLGNPGEKYRRSRHNMGFWVVDILAARYGISLAPMHSKSLGGRGIVGSKPVYLLQPQTFMNLSGEAVAPLVSESGISLEHLAVVHDDLDLEFGRIQIRMGGGDGGHRGVRSVIEHLDSRDFVRLRLGIGRPAQADTSETEPKDFVLSEFNPDELQGAKELANKAADAMESWLTQGLVSTMNRFNRRKSLKSKQETPQKSSGQWDQG